METGALSFKLKDNPPVRVRCSVHDRNNDGYYEVGDDIILTSRRSTRGILGTLQPLPVSEGSSKYTLHETSCSWLEELCHNPYSERSSILADEDNYNHVEEPNKLEEGFYQVEKVLEHCMKRHNMTTESDLKSRALMMTCGCQQQHLINPCRSCQHCTMDRSGNIGLMSHLFCWTHDKSF